MEIGSPFRNIVMLPKNIVILLDIQIGPRQGAAPHFFSCSLELIFF